MWCPQWWRPPKAVSRVESLWRAWETLTHRVVGRSSLGGVGQEPGVYGVGVHAPGGQVLPEFVAPGVSVVGAGRLLRASLWLAPQWCPVSWIPPQSVTTAPVLTREYGAWRGRGADG